MESHDSNYRMERWPGVKDEPQHVKQGEITLDLLNVMGIDYKIIDNKTKNIENLVKEVVDNTKEFSDLRLLLSGKEHLLHTS